MTVLLDTQVWLWLRASPERISAPARRAIDEAGERALSLVSAWEMTIKHGLGKLELPVDVAEYLRSRIAADRLWVLPVLLEHVLELSRLPLHHRDPFDRLLVAQARVEGLTLVTADGALAAYDVEVVRA